VAFATPTTVNADLNKIDVVQNWGPRMGNHDKIPSIISYSPTSHAGELQWGASLSPGSVAMANTKLELDVQDTKLDELVMILKALDGMKNLHFDHIAAWNGHPAYTGKAPEDIVTDYLGKVCQYLVQMVLPLGAGLKAHIPVDIAITVPLVSALFLSFSC
jgi:hypothetical protein